MLGSVVRRTEPHVRYLSLDSVRGSCLSLFSCVTSIFRCGFLVSHIKRAAVVANAAVVADAETLDDTVLYLVLARFAAFWWGKRRGST